MPTDAAVVLERLHCIREKDDESDHSEPYIWPALVWVAASTEVGVVAPASSRARRVIKPDMRPGESADIVSSVGILSAHVEDGFERSSSWSPFWRWTSPRSTLSPPASTRSRANSGRYHPPSFVLSTALTRRSGSRRSRRSKNRSKNKVPSVIFHEVAAVLPSCCPMWMTSSARSSSPSARFPIPALPYPSRCPSEWRQDGQLLLFHDTSQTVGVPLAQPRLIGFSGWADFKFLFAGANQTIYAVDQDGQLLLFRDASQTVGVPLANPGSSASARLGRLQVPVRRGQPDHLRRR